MDYILGTTAVVLLGLYALFQDKIETRVEKSMTPKEKAVLAAAGAAGVIIWGITWYVSKLTFTPDTQFILITSSTISLFIVSVVSFVYWCQRESLWGSVTSGVFGATILMVGGGLVHRLTHEQDIVTQELLNQLSSIWGLLHFLSVLLYAAVFASSVFLTIGRLVVLDRSAASTQDREIVEQVAPPFICIGLPIGILLGALQLGGVLTPCYGWDSRLSVLAQVSQYNSLLKVKTVVGSETYVEITHPTILKEEGAYWRRIVKQGASADLELPETVERIEYYLRAGKEINKVLISFPDHLQRQVVDVDWSVAETKRVLDHLIEVFGEWSKIEPPPFAASDGN